MKLMHYWAFQFRTWMRLTLNGKRTFGGLETMFTVQTGKNAILMENTYIILMVNTTFMHTPRMEARLWNGIIPDMEILSV